MRFGCFRGGYWCYFGLLFQFQAKKLEENHAWFVGTLSMFKPPSEKSKEALNSDLVKIKEHQLVIKPQLKDKALRISSHLNLDEIQSYILVERSMEQEYGTTDSVAQELTQEFIDMVSSLRVSASFWNFQSSFLHINQCFVVWVESCEGDDL